MRRVATPLLADRRKAVKTNFQNSKGPVWRPTTKRLVMLETMVECPTAPLTLPSPLIR